MVFTTDSRSSRLEAGVQVGDFCIEERIGAEGMGIVYRARQISLNRIVALKILGNALTTSTDIIRFQREAQGVVHKATDRDPEVRYQSASELAADHQLSLDRKPVATKPYRYHMDLTEIGATRPRVVLIVSIIAIALGLFCVTGAFLGMLWYVSYGATDAFGAGIRSFVCSVATLLSGWGLFYARNWARWFAIASACALGILFSFTAIADIAEYADELGLYIVLILHVLILSICMTTVLCSAPPVNEAMVCQS